MRRILCVTFLVLVLPFGSAQARTLHDPVRVRALGEPPQLAEGKATTLTLEFSSAARATVSGLALDGPGWAIRLEETHGSFELEPAKPRVVRLEATPDPAAGPLTLRYQVDGRPTRRAIDLSGRGLAHARATGVSRVTEYGGATASPEVLQARPRSEKLRSRERLLASNAAALAADAQMPREGPSALARNITVTGRIIYQRTRADGTGADAMGADLVRVVLYDEDDLYDEFLAETETDAMGNFSFTIHWDPGPFSDAQPDLLIYYETENAKTKVQTAGVFETDYSWQSGTVDDYAGVLLSFGNQTPSDESEHGALHLLTTVTRAWRWANQRGYNPSRIEVQWPEGDSEDASYYVDAFEEMHISPGDEFRESTICHEYGHHWIENFGADVVPDYCNGLCDDGECGHCSWCHETQGIAWTEGFPDWFGSRIARSLGPDYGQPDVQIRQYENLGVCDEAAAPQPPDETEGFLAALLRDIEDSTQDDNDAANVWQDRLSLGPDEILQVADLDLCDSPSLFLSSFKMRFPQHVENLWETAKDIGFEIDLSNPAVVTNLGSSSHALLVESTDATIDYIWTRATDDASGVSGYSYLLSGSPLLPDANEDLGDVTSFSTQTLGPGSWYFNLRTRDRSGKWSASYAAYGPLTIQTPEGPNLAFRVQAGWGSVVVPRTDPDAAVNSCPDPVFLVGDVFDTYWNAPGQNTGELPCPRASSSRPFIDGVASPPTALGIIGAGGTFTHLNRGPVLVRPGRHTFEVGFDANEEIAESEETDNRWAEQWIWQPTSLANGSSVVRSAPPDRTAGWDAIGPGPATYYNCDGLRFFTAVPWTAVTLRALGAADDYDVRLHSPLTGVQSGYDANLGWSTQLAGRLDAVLVNRRTSGLGSWDVGVININHGTSDYRAQMVMGQTFPFGDSLALPIADQAGLILLEFNVAALDVGSVTIKMRHDPSRGPIRARWYDSDFVRGDLLDSDGMTSTDENGEAQFVLGLYTAGYRGLAIYRNPEDFPGMTPDTVVVEIGPTPPDFTPFQAANWYAPLVPRPANDGAPGAVPMPISLTGNAAATWVNYGAINQSDGVAASGMMTHVDLDGVHAWSLSWGDFLDQESRTFNSGTARTVRGGRHTMSMRHDAPDAFEELLESNNHWGEQWVWSPLALTLGTAVTRGAPPDRTGAFEDITTIEPLWYNCDGLRTPVFAAAGLDGFWGAVAVMPGDQSDVDVRFHEILPGVKAGFAANRVISAWGSGQSDYVLAHFRHTGFRAFDAGVLQVAGTESYTAEVVNSKFRLALPSGNVGPFTLAPGHLLDLHEFTLQAGTYLVELLDGGGGIDWGLTLHQNDAANAFQSKSVALVDGSAWSAPPGQNEHIVVQVPSAGPYCLAVWKAKASQVIAGGSYVLRFTPNPAVAVTESAPSRTTLAAPYPNPARHGASVAFDLAREDEVRLEIFDMRGARVRSLAIGRRPAGRHRLTWDGRDESGRSAPSGLYFVRMEANGIRESRKLVVARALP
ncbi:MAG: T9SS type A sorting domain-containing protein [Candidatus Eisenbacteria bacterium]|uniref:T9SS type A sorting domain-containing protein n=1 Tax=Eiseniibacteriota bacterium TaxID=2212470 RepID=A0A849SWJ9_UNCEI|nr:T9SS type A sorting domain-containing protein [Candidatus Eisenbacteria bacterium]